MSVTAAILGSAAIGGGASLLNAAANYGMQKDAQVWQSSEAEKARVFNSVEAQKQRDWQTEMSNTAYQRAASDMAAAGINPASLGGDSHLSGASTPGGYAASVNAMGSLLGRVNFDAAAKALSQALFMKYAHSASQAGSAAEAAKAIKDSQTSVSKILDRDAEARGMGFKDFEELDRVVNTPWVK